MRRNVRGLATNVEHIVMMIINQRGNDILYSLSISSSVFMKLTMIGGNLLRIKLDFVLLDL